MQLQAKFNPEKMACVNTLGSVRRLLGQSQRASSLVLAILEELLTRSDTPGFAHRSQPSLTAHTDGDVPRPEPCCVLGLWEARVERGLAHHQPSVRPAAAASTCPAARRKGGHPAWTGGRSPAARARQAERCLPARCRAAGPSQVVGFPDGGHPEAPASCGRAAARAAAPAPAWSPVAPDRAAEAGAHQPSAARLLRRRARRPWTSCAGGDRRGSDGHATATRRPRIGASLHFHAPARRAHGPHGDLHTSEERPPEPSARA